MRPQERPKNDKIQEVRIGRHRDKLEKIRESLRAYEQNGDVESAEKPPDSTRVHISEAKHLNGNFPSRTSDVQVESRSSRSATVFQTSKTTPIAPLQYKSTYELPSSSRGLTPAAPDYVRSHLRITTAPYVARDNVYRTNIAIPGKTQIVIEPQRQLEMMKEPKYSPSPSDMRNWPKRAQPLYHATLSNNNNSAPSTSVVKINISSPQINQHRGDLSNLNSNAPKSAIIGGAPNSNRHHDTDISRVYYEDGLLPQAYKEMTPSTSTAYDDERHWQPSSALFMSPQNLDITLQTNFKSASHPTAPLPRYASSEPLPSPSSPRRCTSPLPLEIRLQAPKFESSLQVCKPNMLCFYMEQHVERLLQQYREREKRTQQLEKEMSAANLPDVMRQKMLELLQQKESRYTRLRRQKMSKDMFTLIQHIGVGAFGKVSLVRKKDTGMVYAMKSLEKADVIIKNQAAHVKAERDILAEADSPWIVRLFFSFQDERCLYFIMEYVPGGDMMQLLINKGIFEESLARFYIAELTCAIEYVHSVGFIHRDIKPDNILIDKFGHIKLTDFGLCTGLRWTHDRRYYGAENEHIRDDSFSLPANVSMAEENIKLLNIRNQKKRNCAHSVVGTGNYMAPEVLSRSGHTQLCDWWSAGVILYEMVFGRPPFMSLRDDPRETQEKILNWRIYLDVSPSAGGGRLSQMCISIIQEFISDGPKRLGLKGASQVKQHPWFKGIDFSKLRQSRAEFVPKVEHAADTSNFDTIQINDTAESLNMRAPTNPAFYEFTYRHFFDTDGMGCPSLRPPSARRPSLMPVIENSLHADNHDDGLQV